MRRSPGRSPWRWRIEVLAGCWSFRIEGGGLVSANTKQRVRCREKRREEQQRQCTYTGCSLRSLAAARVKSNFFNNSLKTYSCMSAFAPFSFSLPSSLSVPLCALPLYLSYSAIPLTSYARALCKFSSNQSVSQSVSQAVMRDQHSWSFGSTRMTPDCLTRRQTSSTGAITTASQARSAVNT